MFISQELTALFRQKAWAILSGGISLLIIANTLSLAEQGLYFMFLSVAATQILFEAGMSAAFVYSVAHENAKLSELTQDTDRMIAKSRLMGLASFATKWYRGVAVSYFLIVGGVGLLVIRDAVYRDQVVLNWEAPFFFLVFGASISLFNLSRLSILEGSGQISKVANIRFLAGFVSSLVQWIGLLKGYGVWSLSAAVCIQSIIIVILTRHSIAPHREHGDDGSVVGGAVNWKREIFPFQLRLAGSYFAGYVISQALIPYTVSTHGLIAAGKLGLTLSVFNSLGALLAVYSYAAAPKYASMLAVNNFASLRKKFLTVTFSALFAGSVIYLSVGIVVVFLRAMESPISDRFASTPLVISIAIISLIDLAVGCVATLLRAQRKEPMLYPSLATAAAYLFIMKIFIHETIEQQFQAFAVSALIISVPLTVRALVKSGLLRSASGLSGRSDKQ